MYNIELMTEICVVLSEASLVMIVQSIMKRSKMMESAIAERSMSDYIIDEYNMTVLESRQTSTINGDNDSDDENK